MARRVPQRAFEIGQLSTPSVQYTERFCHKSVQYIEQMAEQCETVTASEALRTSETRNSRHAPSNDIEGSLELIETWGHLETTQGLRKTKTGQRN